VTTWPLIFISDFGFLISDFPSWADASDMKNQQSEIRNYKRIGGCIPAALVVN
jgi:hypothetical protein